MNLLATSRLDAAAADSLRPVDSRTRTRILDAALRNIALFGEDRLSMSGVADQAGLSRGTVYRYFTNRDELLDALGQHVLDSFKLGVSRAVEGGGEPEDVLRRVLDHRVDRRTRVAVRRLRELQPAFTLSFLTEHRHEFKAVFAGALGPLFAAGDVAISLDDFCEYLVRLAVTETLFDDDSERISRLVLTLWNAIAPHRTSKAGPRTTANTA
jgi:AcrR family transcriptional regulator